MSSDTRPAKRHKTGVPTHALPPFNMQINRAFVPLLVSCSQDTMEPEAASSSKALYDVNEDHLGLLHLFDHNSTKNLERPTDNSLSFEDIDYWWNTDAYDSEGIVDDHINIDEDSACGSSGTKNISRHYDTLCEGEQPNKKRRRSVLYIDDDRGRTKAHSGRCKRISQAVTDLDTATQPFIFLYIARPESVTSKRAKPLVYISSTLQKAFDFMGNSCPSANIDEIIKSYIGKQTPMGAKVQQVQAELLVEQRRRQAAEARLASLTQQ